MLFVLYSTYLWPWPVAAFFDYLETGTHFSKTIDHVHFWVLGEDTDCYWITMFTPGFSNLSCFYQD